MVFKDESHKYFKSILFLVRAKTFYIIFVQIRVTENLFFCCQCSFNYAVTVVRCALLTLSSAAFLDALI